MALFVLADPAPAVIQQGKDAGSSLPVTILGLELDDSADDFR